jgi:uncharacterized membrane protein YdcZ (DUF606 family)
VERLLAVLATLVVGGLVAFQPPINSQLARHSTILAAAFLSTLISAVVLGLLVQPAARAKSGMPEEGLEPPTRGL